MDDATRAVIHRAQGLHAAIGAEIVKEGDYRQCEGCGQTQPLTPELAAQYLRSGWPRCCGKEMAWKKAGSDGVG